MTRRDPNPPPAFIHEMGLQGHDLGACPFCGKQLSVGYENGRPNAIIHGLPTCKPYEANDPLTFVRMCNLRVAAMRGVGLG